jgi:hypothetical protein
MSESDADVAAVDDVAGVVDVSTVGDHEKVMLFRVVR